ncbi:MAG: NAD(P)/FAD-dependent oxidoreductase, partial [Microcystis panniformis]
NRLIWPLKPYLPPILPELSDYSPLKPDYLRLKLDPLIGEGIRPAILTGVKAASAIDRALAGDNQALAGYSRIIREEWGEDMALAAKLAGLFYQFTQIAYNVAVKRPIAGQLMGRILVGDLKYRDVTEQAMQQLKKLLLPRFGW